LSRSSLLSMTTLLMSCDASMFTRAPRLGYQSDRRFGQNPILWPNACIACNKEAAGAADAELCHTEAALGRISSPSRFCAVKMHLIYYQHIRIQNP
jgi:hypothetical protein